MEGVHQGIQLTVNSIFKVLNVLISYLGEFRSPRGCLLGVLVASRVSGRPGVSSSESRALVFGDLTRVAADLEDTPGVLALAVPRFDSDLLTFPSLASRKVSGRPGVSRRVASTPGDLTGVMVSTIPRATSRSWLDAAVSS